MIKLEYERENKFTVEKNFARLLSLQNTKLLKGNGREMFRLIIAGGRDFADYELLRAFVDFKLSRKCEEIQIISGGARGADALGERYAAERGYLLRRFPADWKQYGRAAGVRRNKEMAQNADALIAFWNGESRGTKNMIEEATAAGIIVCIKRY